jgi:hypothetical protein
MNGVYLQTTITTLLAQALCSTVTVDVTEEKVAMTCENERWSLLIFFRILGSQARNKSFLEENGLKRCNGSEDMVDAWEQEDRKANSKLCYICVPYTVPRILLTMSSHRQSNKICNVYKWGRHNAIRYAGTYLRKLKHEEASFALLSAEWKMCLRKTQNLWLNKTGRLLYSWTNRVKHNNCTCCSLKQYKERSSIECYAKIY